MIRRTTHLLFEVLAAVAVGAVVLGAIVAWRLSQGPVSVGFLSPYIQESLSQPGSNVRILMQDTVLTWAGWERQLDVRAVGVRAFAPDGTILADLPEISVGISIRALMRGLIAPTYLDFIRPRVRVVRAEDGGFDLEVGDTPAAENVSESIIGGLFDSLFARPDRSSRTGYLRRISAVDAVMQVDDRRWGVTWSVPDADIVLDRRRGGLAINASFSIRVGGGTARFNGDGEYIRKDRRIRGSASFRRVRPELFAAGFKVLAGLDAIRLPVDGTVSFDFTLDGSLNQAHFDLVGGAGEVRYPALWPKPLEVRRMRLQGGLEQHPDRLTVERFEADLGGPRVTATMSASRVGDDAVVQAQLGVTGVPMNETGRYWPVAVGANPRPWVTGNLKDGTVTQAQVNLSLRQPLEGDKEAQLDSIFGTIRFKGGTVRYAPKLPPVRGVDGSAAFTADRFDIKIEHGHHGKLTIDEGSIAITGLDKPSPPADIELVIRGPVRDALTLLNHPGIDLVSSLGIDPARTGGTAATRLILRVPLHDDTKLSDIRIRAASNMRDVAVTGILAGADLTDGQLVLRVDDKGLDLSGKGQIAGAPADIVWIENFVPDAPIRRRYRIKTVQSAEALASLGFDATSVLTGPLGLNIALRERQGRKAELQAAVDLGSAKLTLPGFNWTKDAGEAGKATLIIGLEDDRPVTLRQVAIDAGTLSIEGNGVFLAGTRTLEKLTLTRFHLEPTDLRGTIIHRGDGGYDVDIAGPVLDVSPFLKRSGKPLPDMPPVTLSAQVDTLWLGGTIPLSNVVGALRHDGKAWRQVVLDGVAGGNGKTKLRLGPDAGGALFSLSSGDAGAALSALGVTDKIRGGSLQLSAKRKGNDQAPWAGTIAIREFRALDVPALARLLSVASLSGVGALLSGEGLPFSQFDVPFTLRDQRLEFENARAVGSELGLTAEGLIDFGADNVEIRGTIVPAYTLNSLLGNIPILGDILTGGKGSGIFAATFRMNGAIADPKISVNPLAALAPGFLRNLFGGRLPEGVDVPPVGDSMDPSISQ